MKYFGVRADRLAVLAATVAFLGATTEASIVNHSRGPRRSHFQRAPDNWPIKKGYVAFGDSYGAGMGTGTTTTDSCRVGSNNFADLLMRWTNNNNVDFQRKVCSGDTTVGLNRQIDEWKNPSKADIATVSIGGNDLGFSDLVWYCVVTPNTFKTGASNRQKCVEKEAAARQLLDDNGDNGLGSKLTKAYKKILEKSGRDVSILNSECKCTFC
jgi:hypothetical protein